MNKFIAGLLALFLFANLCAPAFAQDLQFQIKKDATSVLLPITVLATATGNGMADIDHNESGLSCYYHRNTAGAPVQITLAAGALGTWSSGGWVAASNSNMAGDYQLGVPNAAFVTGADNVKIACKGVSGMRDARITVQLINFDLNVGTQNCNVVSNSDKTGYSLASSQTFSTTGACGSVTAGVTVATNNDKTGYRIAGVKDSLDELNDVSVEDVWNAALENWPTAGSAGNYLDAIKHYVANKWVLDPKTNRYSVKNDDGETEYESGVSKSTERSPNRD